MSIPETTSTEGLEPYLGGKCLFHSRGDAWRDLKAWIVDQPPEGDTSTLPSGSESFIAWTISGEVDFQEREYKRPWITHRIRKGSFGQLFVSAMAQAIAIHLARNYAETVDESRRGGPSLPAYKLKRVTELMAEHFAEDLNLEQLAAQIDLSKFHFDRLFKRATGLSPSRYQIDLRMNEARRLLRETKKSILDVALEVGYTNPSHFAKLFRRENGLTPSEYRQQR